MATQFDGDGVRRRASGTSVGPEFRMTDSNMTASSDEALSKVRSPDEELRKARELLAAAASKETDKLHRLGPKAAPAEVRRFTSCFQVLKRHEEDSRPARV